MSTLRGPEAWQLSASALPVWADNKLGREALRLIRENPPEEKVSSGDSFNCGGRRSFRAWNNPPVAQLRKLHKEWREREEARLQRIYVATGFYDQQAANEILAAPDTDALIRQQCFNIEEQRAA